MPENIFPVVRGMLGKIKIFKYPLGILETGKHGNEHCGYHGILRKPWKFMHIMRFSSGPEGHLKRKTFKILGKINISKYPLGIPRGSPADGPPALWVPSLIILRNSCIFRFSSGLQCHLKRKTWKSLVKTNISKYPFGIPSGRAARALGPFFDNP